MLWSFVLQFRDNREERTKKRKDRPYQTRWFLLNDLTFAWDTRVALTIYNFHHCLSNQGVILSKKPNKDIDQRGEILEFQISKEAISSFG